MEELIDAEDDENMSKNVSVLASLVLILKKNTMALVWKYIGFEADECGRPCSTDVTEMPIVLPYCSNKRF